jgi:hypothetical protein
MVFQEIKQRGISICVDLRKLNDAFLHDPFPNPFTYAVIENVGDQEAYSFTDGFSGYHEIKISLEERYKTTFSRAFITYFKEFIHQFLEVYMDESSVYCLLKDHVEVLRLMLER